MVSLTKIYLGFVGLPMASYRSKVPISISNYKYNLEPVGVFNPLTIVNRFFVKDSPSYTIPKELPEKILYSLRSDPDCQFDTYSELNELDSTEKKEEFLQMLLFAWDQREIDLSISKLMSFKRLVEYLELSNDVVYSSLQKIYRNCIDINNLSDILVLKHVFKKSGKPLPSDDYHILYKNQQRDTNSILRLARGSLINDEFESILIKEMQQLQFDDPPTYPKTKEEFKKFKKKLLDLSTNRVNFEEFPRYKIKQLSYVLYQHIWSLDYFKNKQMPTIPEEVMNILELDQPYCKVIFNNLIDRHINHITLVTIPHIVGKESSTHRYLVHRKFLEEELKFTLSEFETFKKLSKHKLNSLKQKGVDLCGYDVDYKPFGRVGGMMPYVNVKALVPENPKMENQCKEEAERDELEELEEMEDDKCDDGHDEEQMSREEVEQLRKGLQHAEDELRICSHLMKPDRNDLYLGKIPQALEAARRGKQRRLLLQSHNNPFNTRSDLEEFISYELKVAPPKEKSKEIDENDARYPYEQLSKIRTEYMKYLMQIDNITWNLLSSEMCPIDTLGKLYSSGQSIIRPNPKELDFSHPAYNQCFAMLEGFKKKNVNTEADRYRRRRFKESVDPNKTQTDYERLNERKAFNDDPKIKHKDLPLLTTHLHTGGRLHIETAMKLNIMRDPTDSQKRTYFYRKCISQPIKMRRCKNCQAVVFLGPVKTRENNSFDLDQAKCFMTFNTYCCRNCGSSKSHFEETWNTGARGHKTVPYVEEEEVERPVDKYGLPMFD